MCILMRPIHKDIRYLAVLNFRQCKDWKATCSIFKISRSSLLRFAYKYQCGLSLDTKKKTQPTKFSEEHRSFVVQLVQKKRNITVNRIIVAFNRKYKIKISHRTVRRILKNNQITYRTLYVKSKVHRRKKQFHKKIKAIPISRMLSIDEMGISHGHIHPKKAWCSKLRKNQIYKINTKFIHYNKTVVCLISSKGVVDYQWQGKPMNSNTFSEFLSVALHGFTGYYLILDNIGFHKTKKVISVLKNFGITPIYIDPYTPEQNPIEELFSSVKAFLKYKSPVDDCTFDKCLRKAMCRQKQHSVTKYFNRAVFR